MTQRFRGMAVVVAACAALAAAGAPALGSGRFVPNGQVVRALPPTGNPWGQLNIPDGLVVEPPAPGESALPRQVLGPDEAPPSSTVIQAGVYSIPGIVLQAYREAARRTGETQPGCNLTWPLLASIGRIESGHARGGDVGPDGRTRSPIVGPRLDGTASFARIGDSDKGVWDGDTAFDRAVGPMQFLPGSWRLYGRDGNGDGVRDPHNVFDAAMAAGAHLCAFGHDLSVESDLLKAVFGYNRSWQYVSTVLSWARAYASGVVPGGQQLPVGAPAGAAGPPGPVIAAAPSATGPSTGPSATAGASTPTGTPTGTPSGSSTGSPSGSPTTPATGSILGSVVDDLNRGIPGVRVTLSDSLGGPVPKVTTTSAGGDFSFGGLPAGAYTVTEAEATGYADESPNVHRVQLASGAQVAGVRFTERTSVLTGLVFADANDNGRPDAGEQGIPDVEIRLTGVDDRGRNVDLTLRTEGNGSFRFTGLLSGVYTITEVTQPADYRDGRESAPQGDTSHDDQIVDVPLAAGVLVGGFGFGELPVTPTPSGTEPTGTPPPSGTASATASPSATAP